MPINVLVVIAHGTEEMEAICSADILARGGCTVTLASVSSTLEVKGSKDITLKAGALLKDCANTQFDMILLPGGMPGAKNLHDCALLGEMLKAQKAADRWIAAICAAPAVVLNEMGLLESKSTCYPGFELKNTENTGSDYEVSGKVVTGKGPGVVMQFALKCLELLQGEETSKKIMKGLLLKNY